MDKAIVKQFLANTLAAHECQIEDLEFDEYSEYISGWFNLEGGSVFDFNWKTIQCKNGNVLNLAPGNLTLITA